MPLPIDHTSNALRLTWRHQFQVQSPLPDAHTNMSASDDDATPAPDADDEAQNAPAGTAAAGSSGDPTMAQEVEGGQPKEEEEPTDILDRLRREDEVEALALGAVLGAFCFGVAVVWEDAGEVDALWRFALGPYGARLPHRHSLPSSCSGGGATLNFVRPLMANHEGSYSPGLHGVDHSCARCLDLNRGRAPWPS